MSANTDVQKYVSTIETASSSPKYFHMTRAHLKRVQNETQFRNKKKTRKSNVLKKKVVIERTTMPYNIVLVISHGRPEHSACDSHETDRGRGRGLLTSWKKEFRIAVIVRYRR